MLIRENISCKFVLKFAFGFVILFLLNSGCQGRFTSTLVHKGKDVCINTDILIDSISFNAERTSCVGFFFMDDSLICFSDRLYCSLFRFNLNGTFVDRKFGKGSGPGELPALRKMFNVPGKDYYYSFDQNNMLYQLDKRKWTVKRLGRIDFGWDKSVQKIGSDYANCYYFNTLNYPGFVFHEINDSTLIFPVKADHKKFSGSSVESNANKYYTTGKIFGELNLNSNKVDRLFGFIPEFYQQYEFLSNFNGFSYDCQGDTIYVDYAADSLMHVYKYPDKFLYTIGFSGRDMNQDYKETSSYEAAKKQMREDALIFGRYSCVKYIKETNALLRVYYKGNHSETDGLQVYKNNDLIADFDVPKHFQVIGFCNGYYYAVKYVPEQTGQEFNLYKFKLEKNEK